MFSGGCCSAVLLTQLHNRRFQQSNPISPTGSDCAVTDAWLYVFHGGSANSCGNYKKTFISCVCFTVMHAALGQIFMTVYDLSFFASSVIPYACSVFYVSFFVCLIFSFPEVCFYRFLFMLKVLKLKSAPMSPCHTFALFMPTFTVEN